MLKHTVFMLTCSVLAAGALRAAEAPGALEPLRPGDLSQECRCSFSLQPRSEAEVRPVFALDLTSGKGLVRVGGALVRLTRVSSEESRKSRSRDTVGDRYTEVWTDDSTEVTLKYRTTFVCAEDDAVCAHTGYQGRMTVEHGSYEKRFEVWGSCGCPTGR